tara:strand:- start:190 stop:654 length:465 start_codon:yes stop_codon:yes gene_type:complete
MHIFEKNIQKLNIIVPKINPPYANYVPTKIVDNLLYISGQAPSMDGKFPYLGKVGKDITEEEGIKAAELCGISIISAIKFALDDNWDKLDTFVKIGGFVNCESNFVNQPKIINGASDLMVKIFEEQGRHTRFAVGTNSLPLNIPVEIDAIVKIK